MQLCPRQSVPGMTSWYFDWSSLDDLSYTAKNPDDRDGKVEVSSPVAVVPHALFIPEIQAHVGNR